MVVKIAELVNTLVRDQKPVAMIRNVPKVNTQLMPRLHQQMTAVQIALMEHIHYQVSKLAALFRNARLVRNPPRRLQLPPRMVALIVAQDCSLAQAKKPRALLRCVLLASIRLRQLQHQTLMVVTTVVLENGQEQVQKLAVMIKIVQVGNNQL